MYSTFQDPQTAATAGMDYNDPLLGQYPSADKPFTNQVSHQNDFTPFGFSYESPFLSGQSNPGDMYTGGVYSDDCSERFQPSFTTLSANGGGLAAGHAGFGGQTKPWGEEAGSNGPNDVNTGKKADPTLVYPATNIATGLRFDQLLEAKLSGTFAGAQPSRAPSYPPASMLDSSRTFLPSSAPAAVANPHSTPVDTLQIERNLLDSTQTTIPPEFVAPSYSIGMYPWGMQAGHQDLSNMGVQSAYQQPPTQYQAQPTRPPPQPLYNASQGNSSYANGAPMNMSSNASNTSLPLSFTSSSSQSIATPNSLSPGPSTASRVSPTGNDFHHRANTIGPSTVSSARGANDDAAHARSATDPSAWFGHYVNNTNMSLPSGLIPKSAYTHPPYSASTPSTVAQPNGANPAPSAPAKKGPKFSLKASVSASSRLSALLPANMDPVASTQPAPALSKGSSTSSNLSSTHRPTPTPVSPVLSRTTVLTQSPVMGMMAPPSVVPSPQRSPVRGSPDVLQAQAQAAHSLNAYTTVAGVPMMLDLDAQSRKRKSLSHDTPSPASKAKAQKCDSHSIAGPNAPLTAPSTKKSEEEEGEKKIVIACHRCRAKKLKCDGVRPRCHHCSRHLEDTCSYDEVLRRRGPGRNNKKNRAKAPKGERQGEEGRSSLDASGASGTSLPPSSAVSSRFETSQTRG